MIVVVNGGFDPVEILSDLRNMKYPQQVRIRGMGLHPLVLPALRETIPGTSSPNHEAGAAGKYGCADDLFRSLSDLAQFATVRGSQFQVTIGEALPPVNPPAEEAAPAERKPRSEKKASE